MCIRDSSQATPLAEAAQGGLASYDMASMFWGLIPGSIGETSTFCILLGAILLIATGIGSWKIMLSTFIGGYCMALLLNYTCLLYTSPPLTRRLLSVLSRRQPR